MSMKSQHSCLWCSSTHFRCSYWWWCCSQSAVESPKDWNETPEGAVACGHCPQETSCSRTIQADSVDLCPGKSRLHIPLVVRYCWSVSLPHDGQVIEERWRNRPIGCFKLRGVPWLDREVCPSPHGGDVRGETSSCDQEVVWATLLHLASSA